MKMEKIAFYISLFCLGSFLNNLFDTIGMSVYGKYCGLIFMFIVFHKWWDAWELFGGDEMP